MKEQLGELPEGGVLVWGDASARFGRPKAAMYRRLAEVGFLGMPTSPPIADFTHPATIRELARLSPVVGSGNIRDYTAAPMVCGCVGFWVNRAFVRDTLLEPLVQCALQQSCIQPSNASGFQLNGVTNRNDDRVICRKGLEGRCHRGDQSALSTILYEAFKGRQRAGVKRDERFIEDISCVQLPKSGSTCPCRAFFARLMYSLSENFPALRIFLINNRHLNLTWSW